MSIKSQGGVFGRNPTFNDVTVEGDLSVAGSLTIGGSVITGLNYQGAWDADINTPDLTAASPATGQFWIVSVAGSTNLGGITNWTVGDWALYDGSNWQRVEGGNTDLSTGVQGQLAVANGGTGAADAATARTNLGLGTAATTASTDYATAAQGATADSALQPADIGVSVQGYDATILTSSDIGSTVQGYDANILTSSDIGSTVQAYDADTAKYDAATAAFTGNLSVDSTTLYVDATSKRIGIGTNNPAINFHINGGTANQIALLESTDATVKLGFKDSSTTNNYSVTIGADGNEMIFSSGSGGNEAARFTTSGNLAFPSGQGIDFSATSGTGTSELLDDYEEGTWTPSVGVGTVSVSSATYTKIGRLVRLKALITSPSDITTASDFLLSGLPFAIASSQFGTGSTLFRYINLGGGQLSSQITGTDVSFYASDADGGNFVKMQHTHITSASMALYFDMHYETA